MRRRRLRQKREEESSEQRARRICRREMGSPFHCLRVRNEKYPVFGFWTGYGGGGGGGAVEQKSCALGEAAVGFICPDEGGQEKNLKKK